MKASTETRLLQGAIIAAGAFTLVFAATSVIQGVRVLLPGDAGASLDLDSHFRYLSGILLGIVIAFYSCVPGIEHKGPRLRLLGGLVICGGLARLVGLFVNGVPGTGHLIGLTLELGVTPLLLLWHAGFTRRRRADLSA